MYAHYHNTMMVNTVADCTCTIRLLHLLVCLLFMMIHKTMIKEVMMTTDITPPTANPEKWLESHTIAYGQCILSICSQTYMLVEYLINLYRTYKV